MTDHLKSVPTLGLVLNHDRHRATRDPGSFIDLGGHVRLWKLLVALSSRYESYYRKNDLIAAVWDEDRLAYGGIEEGTLYWAISNLRRRLRPLELTIKYVKGVGYRLEDLREPTA
jgi:DNA-binding winged helix-turn-helix (wHTH) protein